MYIWSILDIVSITWKSHAHQTNRFCVPPPEKGERLVPGLQIETQFDIKWSRSDLFEKQHQHQCFIFRSQNWSEWHLMECTQLKRFVSTITAAHRLWNAAPQGWVSYWRTISMCGNFRACQLWWAREDSQSPIWQIPCRTLYCCSPTVFCPVLTTCFCCEMHILSPGDFITNQAFQSWRVTNDSLVWIKCVTAVRHLKLAGQANPTPHPHPSSPPGQG